MAIETKPITINLGPQHPSTHGVFRLRVTFDGETVIDVEPVFGYLHRGTEKLTEERSYVQIVTLTDRLDYTSSMTNNQAYVRAVEKLAGLEVPERGMYLRVIAAELQRIASHLISTGFFLQELGTFVTLLMYCFRERERVLDLFEMLCGARITVSYMRPGGVFQDAPARVLAPPWTRSCGTCRATSTTWRGSSAETRSCSPGPVTWVCYRRSWRSTPR